MFCLTRFTQTINKKGLEKAPKPKGKEEKAMIFGTTYIVIMAIGATLLTAWALWALWVNRNENN